MTRALLNLAGFTAGFAAVAAVLLSHGWVWGTP